MATAPMPGNDSISTTAHTLYNPGTQPELPIIIPKKTRGATRPSHFMVAPEAGIAFREYCTRNEYPLRRACICLMRWAAMNNIHLGKSYKRAGAHDEYHSIFASDVPVHTNRIFRAWCARHGYTVKSAASTLMEWAATEDIQLVGARDADY